MRNKPTEEEIQRCPRCLVKVCCNHFASKHAYSFKHFGYFGKPIIDICNDCEKRLGIEIIEVKR